MSKVIAIDLDGCISTYKDGWKGENVFGDIIPGCKEKIDLLKSKGHKIIIYTSRLATKELEKFLKDNGIYFDALNENPWHEYKQPGNKRKVIADIYIDDRAITFKGNWEEIPQLVENFKPWEWIKKGYNCDNMPKEVKISLPDKITKYLEYLEDNGYGTKSEIITSTGVIPLIIEVYSRVREEEERIELSG